MKDSTGMPCTDWVHKLAARHQDDLSPVDRRALNEHLALCGACNEAYAAYKTLEAGIRRLTMIEQPIPKFSYEPVQPVSKLSAATSTLSLPSLLLPLLITLSSLCVRISWSPFIHAVHTWILVVFSRFPRRVAYASTDNRFLYVMRTDSGFFLWRHKRYKRSDLVSNSPIRGSGMLFIGSGIALAAALDFCTQAVQA
jgi:hypothetical protein